MARQLLRLRLTLLRNGLRRSRAERLALAAALVLFVVPGSVTAFALLLGAGRSDHAEALAVALFTAMLVVWLVLPLLSFGSDETLDPARLALLPVPPRRLVAGLFGAALVGVAPLVTVAALAGAVAGYAPAGPGIVLVLAAVAVQLALCVVASRALTTALSHVLRSRRGRDVVVAASIGLGLLLAVGWNVAVHGALSVERIRTLDPAPVVAVLGWTPPGLAGRALADAQAGALADAALRLGLAAAAAVLLAWAWAAALERALTTAGSGGSPRGRRAAHAPGLVPRVAEILPAGRIRAVAAKELRYAAREPRLRMVWLSTASAILVVAALVLLVEPLRRPGIVFAAPGLLLLAAPLALNAFAYDGGAYWQNAVATGRRRDDLLGKNAAFALLVLPALGTLALVLAALAGAWLVLPVALALSVALAGAALAVGNVASVRAPAPAQPTTTNVWATAGGTGLLVFLVQMLALAAFWVLVGPVVVAAGIAAAAWPPAVAIVAALAVPYGLGLWWVGVLVADERLRGAEPEFLAALAPRR